MRVPDAALRNLFGPRFGGVWPLGTGDTETATQWCVGVVNLTPDDKREVAAWADRQAFVSSLIAVEVKHPADQLTRFERNLWAAILATVPAQRVSHLSLWIEWSTNRVVLEVTRKSEVAEALASIGERVPPDALTIRERPGVTVRAVGDHE